MGLTMAGLSDRAGGRTLRRPGGGPLRAVLLTALCVVVVAACAETAPPVASTEPRSGAALAEALRDGGYVLFLRHTTSDTSHDQGGPPEVTDCGRQRNLSSAGRAEAQQLGEDMGELGVAVGDVLASPFCRTMDTAELAFGGAVEDMRLLQAEDEEAAANLTELLAERPSEGNTVLVGHVGSLGAAADLHIEEGETAVFAPDGDGGFALIATVPVDGWTDLDD